MKITVDKCNLFAVSVTKTVTINTTKNMTTNQNEAVTPWQPWRGELGWYFYLPNFHPLGDEAQGPFDTKQDCIDKANEIQSIS